MNRLGLLNIKKIWYDEVYNDFNSIIAELKLVSDKHDLGKVLYYNINGDILFSVKENNIRMRTQMAELFMNKYGMDQNQFEKLLKKIMLSKHITIFQFEFYLSKYNMSRLNCYIKFNDEL